MGTTVNITPNECDIGDADFDNGHFWRMQFVDPETGDVANITFADEAFFSFLDQMDGIRQKLRH